MTNTKAKPKGKAAPAFRRGKPAMSHNSCSKKRALLKERIRSLEARVINLEVTFGKTFSLGVDVAGKGKI